MKTDCSSWGPSEFVQRPSVRTCISCDMGKAFALSLCQSPFCSLEFSRSLSTDALLVVALLPPRVLFLNKIQNHSLSLSSPPTLSSSSLIFPHLILGKSHPSFSRKISIIHLQRFQLVKNRVVPERPRRTSQRWWSYPATPLLAYTQRKLYFEKIHAPQCSLGHCLQ